MREAEPASSQAHREAAAWLTVGETINPRHQGKPTVYLGTMVIA